MIPAKQTVYSEILEEMFSHVVKTTSEFKIQVWKRKAEQLKDVDIFQYKLLSSIILAYQNKNIEAIKLVESTFALVSDLERRAILYKSLGNMYVHIGEYRLAMDNYWKAFEISKSVDAYDSFFSTCTNFAIGDERLMQTKSLNDLQKKDFELRLAASLNEVEAVQGANLNIEIYRDVIKSAYMIFYKHCSGVLIRLPMISDNSVSTLLFNTKLDLDVVEALNDDMSDALVDLTEKYDFEELLKYPVIFTAENFSDAKDRVVYGG